MKTKNLFNKKITQWLLLVAMLVGCSANAWAGGDSSGSMGVYLNVNGAKTWYKIYDGWGMTCSGWDVHSATSLSGKDLGTVTILKLSGFAIVGWTDSSSDWLSGQVGWSIDSGSKSYYKVGNYGDCNSGKTQQQCSSGNNRTAGYKNADSGSDQSVDLLSGVSVGSHKLNCEGFGQMLWKNTGCGDYGNNQRSTVSATFTVPGFTNVSSGSLTFEDTKVGSSSATQSVTFTMYGSTIKLTTSSLTDFTVSKTDPTGSGKSGSVTVTFKPTTTGDKSETLTLTDNYGKTTSITLTGKGTPACTTPTASNFNVSGLTGKTYNGSEQAPTITAASGMGTMTVKYDGTAGTGKTNAGTYAITVDVAAGTTYCAATGISLGSFVIEKATHPAISVNDQSVCANQSITLSISGAKETSNVTYSINSTGTTGEGTISGSTLNVTTPGIFKIDATKAASANYKAVSTTTPGTITVTPVITWSNYQPNATLDFGSVPIETTSEAITVNFTACNVSNFNASTTSACFAVTNGTASGSGDKSFSVKFTPTAKTTYNGTVSVTWTGGSATFNLTGIGTKDCTPPTKDGYNYTLSDVVYDGSAKPVTVTAKSGYGTPTSVKYNGDTNAPSAVGAYTVSIVVPEYGDYCATTIGLGSFNITCPALTTSYELLITKSSMCAGDAAATITLSGSQPSNRASYQLYRGDTTVGGSVAGTGKAITFSNITESGTYKVKALSTVTGCSSTQQFIDNTTSLTVNPLPSLTTTPSGSAVTAYLWEPVNLTATTTDGTATVAISTTSTKYEVTDITNGKSLKAGNAGDTFTATYTATSTNGCQAQEVKTVTAAKATEDCSN